MTRRLLQRFVRLVGLSRTRQLLPDWSEVPTLQGPPNSKRRGPPLRPTKAAAKPAWAVQPSKAMEKNHTFPTNATPLICKPNDIAQRRRDAPTEQRNQLMTRRPLQQLVRLVGADEYTNRLPNANSSEPASQTPLGLPRVATPTQIAELRSRTT